MKKNLLITAVIVAIMFLGCQKLEIEQNNQNQENMNLGTVSQNLTLADMPQVEVIDGVLSFASREDFDKTLEILSFISNEERMNWEKSIGFTSLKTIQENALDELNNCESENLFNNWLESNKKYFKIENIDGEKYLTTKNELGFYSKISNNNSIYVISENCYKIIGKKIYYLNKNNLYFLLNANESEIAEKAFLLDFSISTKDHMDHQADIKEGGDPVRRCKITADVYSEGGQYYEKTWVVGTVKGYKKVLGVWVNYRTTLSMSGYIGRVYNSNYPTYKSFSFIDQTSSDALEIEQSKNILDVFGTVYFKNINGYGTSRGIDGILCKIEYLDPNL